MASGYSGLERETILSFVREMEKIAIDVAREKLGAMAEDARRTHVGGARPATEDSKDFANQQLQSAQAVGHFKNLASPKTIGVAGHTLKDTLKP